MFTQITQMWRGKSEQHWLLIIDSSYKTSKNDKHNSFFSLFIVLGRSVTKPNIFKSWTLGLTKQTMLGHQSGLRDMFFNQPFHSFFKQCFKHFGHGSVSVCHGPCLNVCLRWVTSTYRMMDLYYQSQTWGGQLFSCYAGGSSFLVNWWWLKPMWNVFHC